MNKTEKKSFRGVLNGEPRDSGRIFLIRNLAHETPLFWTAVGGMKKAGIRKSGETSPTIPAPERSFKLASEHSLVVALIVREIAEMIGLPKQQKQLLITAGLIHDATKKIEISMMDYPKVQTEKDLYKKELEQLIKGIGVVNSDNTIKTILEELEAKNAFEASQYFDETINTPFLEQIFSGPQVVLEKSEKDILINVASSDSFAAIPRNIARTARLVKDLSHTSDACSLFLNYVENMRDNGTLPEVKESDADLLSLILTYADGLAGTTKIEVDGEDKITTTLKKLADRKKESIGNQSYQKLEEDSKPYFGGSTLLTVSYSMQDVIQELLFKIINGDKLPIKTPDDLPQIILDRIQEKAKSN